MTKLHIVHIYPNEMNTYGDRGNLLVLEMRAKWHGLDPVIHYYKVGDQLPAEIDIVLGGGGQDSAQTDIQTDVLRIGDKLRNLVNNDVPMLMVCGTYQLLGNKFTTVGGDVIQGIGVFDIETIGGSQRLIGNTAVETQDFGTLYGFENHSGKTYRGVNQQPFGRVIRGNGNNGEDKTEGARIHNAIGTYMHGPLLPNNPQFADWLLTAALERKGLSFTPHTIDDSLTAQCRRDAATRKY